MWAACHGAVALEIADICMVDDMDRTYEELLDTLVRGISAPSRSIGITGTCRSPGSCSVTRR